MAVSCSADRIGRTCCVLHAARAFSPCAWRVHVVACVCYCSAVQCVTVCVAVCCSVLQCVAVCCGERQCVAVSCSADRIRRACCVPLARCHPAPGGVRMWCCVYVVVVCVLLQCVAVVVASCCSVLQNAVVCCREMQCVAVSGSELQRRRFSVCVLCAL